MRGSKGFIPRMMDRFVYEERGEYHYLFDYIVLLFNI